MILTEEQKVISDYCFLFLFQLGTKAYQRLSSILLKKTTIKDVAKLSTEAQTSCLEGFHSTLI
jgi:hypothetical protein